METMTTERNDVPVSLEQMLAARDRRAERQHAALNRFGLPIVSIGVVMPGPVKDNENARTILAAATEALGSLFAEKKWPIRLFDPVFGITGPEALYAVEANALDIKRSLVELEDAHPLGRLWDLDVICPKQGILSRRALGHAPRRCLACDAEAHACARSQRHSLPQLLDIIAKTVEAHRRPPHA
jgi:holo-ACP synthase